MSPEIEAVRDMVNRFMETEVVPVMDGYEKRGEFPRELVRKAGEAGLYGAVFPESVGGSNMGYLAATVIQEEMVRNDVRFCLVQQPAGLHLPELHLLRRHAGADQEVRAQPDRRQDDRHDVSDRVGRRLRRRRQHEDLRASATATSTASPARRCGPRWPTRPTSAFCSPRPTATRAPRASPPSSSQPKKYPGLEGAADRLPGPVEVACAPTSSSSTTSWCRWKTGWARRARASRSSCARCSRAAWRRRPRRWASRARCFEDAVRYANERTLRGQPIGRFQMIQSDIAEMAVAIEASRALVYKAAMLMDNSLPSQPHRRHRQVPRVADGQDVRRQGHADLRRLRPGRGVPRCRATAAYADMFFTGEGSANVQKIMIAEDALGYKVADRHHGKTGLRDIRKDDVAAKSQR